MQSVRHASRTTTFVAALTGFQLHSSPGSVSNANYRHPINP